jgi:hypothetical protein
MLAHGAAPTSAAKYDMLRGLLRTCNAKAAAAAGAAAAQAGEAGSRKYDLIFDLLQALRTSGEARRERTRARDSPCAVDGRPVSSGCSCTCVPFGVF